MNNIPELTYEKTQLAKDSNTSQETLDVLATDKDCDVRCWVALNPNTSQETLAILAIDKNPDVRIWVAKNSNATEVIRRLVLMTNEELSTASH